MRSPEKTSTLLFLLSDAGCLFVEYFLSIYRYCVIGDEGYTYLVFVNAADFDSRNDIFIAMDND
jgi:hypothetical protein